MARRARSADELVHVHEHLLGEPDQGLHHPGEEKNEGGGVIMDDDTRKQVLVAYQTRKQDDILHPFIDEKVTIGLLPHVQALLMARYLRGDLDGYPPFMWK